MARAQAHDPFLVPGVAPGSVDSCIDELAAVSLLMGEP